MNDMSNATLLIIIQTLTDKVAQQRFTIEEQEAHIRRDHEEMDHMQYRLTDLNRQLSERYDTHEAMRSRNEELYAQVRKLTQENHMLRFNTQTPEETITAYMVAQGASMWERGEKIACLKGAREVSGWNLYDTKSFCEAYMARRQNEKEESGPGTKRSSQIPAGVGTSVRKSA